MPTKEDDLRQRLSRIVLDLSTSGDEQQQWMLGSLAARIVDHAGVGSWGEFKRTMSQETYTSLLTSFQKQGNELARQGLRSQVYAIEVLGVAVICRTLPRDPEITAQAPALDRLIDDAVRVFRSTAAPDPIIS